MTDTELLEQFKLLTQGVASMIEVSQATLRQEMRDSETRMKIYIENTVTKRMDSLFDGYKLNHEKQWELEHRTEQLQDELQDLKTRLTLLESKIA